MSLISSCSFANAGNCLVYIFGENLSKSCAHSLIFGLFFIKESLSLCFPFLYCKRYGGATFSVQPVLHPCNGYGQNACCVKIWLLKADRDLPVIISLGDRP